MVVVALTEPLRQSLNLLPMLLLQFLHRLALLLHDLAVRSNDISKLVFDSTNRAQVIHDDCISC